MPDAGRKGLIYCCRLCFRRFAAVVDFVVVLVTILFFFSNVVVFPYLASDFPNKELCGTFVPKPHLHTISR